VLVEEVSLSLLIISPYGRTSNSSEIDKHLVDKELFKPPTTLVDFYLVGGPPVDNSSDIGYNSADNI